ncbi:MAG: hypothetical protein FD166_898 [Bacteroidetes bacterium]|nr:MAG: hypothetical protein FD166_898 [Bacteroidota bacterium]
MKIHSTNYKNTFILIADDCPAMAGEMPPAKGDMRTVAGMQFEMISRNPYRYTSDDVFFQVYADRNELTEGEYAEARAQFFSKGQPCFRASPLTKRYGWGVHSDSNGKIALYGCETNEYKRFSDDASLIIVKAMKTGK